MLPSFPAIEEDELLYSVVARYHREAGWGGWSDTLEVLFGRRHVVANHELPGYVGVLAAGLAPGDPTATSRLIGGTTLLPYFAATSPAHLRDAAWRAAAQGSGSSHLSLGLAASGVSRVDRLRFCLQCDVEGVAERGFRWWRRRHQLPGTLVCLRHRAPLRVSPIALSRLGRHEFLLADACSCPATCAPAFDVGVDGRLEVLLALAQAEADVLDCGAVDGGDLHPRLAAAGLMRSPRKVDQQELLARARGFFGPAADLLPSALSSRSLGNWMPKMVRAQRRSLHPLLHVAMEVFLDAQPVAPVIEPAAPFGPGPWPCRNPLADHFAREVVARVRTYRTKGSLVGRFECSCGYVYSRSLSGAVQGRPRYVRFGPLLKPALRRLVGEGASLRAAGRTLGIDPSTVIREAAALGISVPWHNARSVRPTVITVPTVPTGAQRPKLQSGPRRPLRDWTSIDAEMLVRFRHAGDILRRQRPPVRITVAALERSAIGRRGWLSKRLGRLPLTAAFVAGAVETTAFFKERRATFVILSSQAPVVPWRVMREAGLTGADMQMICSVVARLRPELEQVAA